MAPDAAASPGVLHVPEGLEKQSLSLVLSYAGIANEMQQQPAQQLQLTRAQGQPLTGFNTICEVLVRGSQASKQLLGSTPEELAQVNHTS